MPYTSYEILTAFSQSELNELIAAAIADDKQPVDGSFSVERLAGGQFFFSVAVAEGENGSFDLTAANFNIAGDLAVGDDVSAGGDVAAEGAFKAGPDANVLSNLKYVTATLDAATLDGAGQVEIVAVGTVNFAVREIILLGGGTNFGAGGNRTIVITDGTNVFTTIPNASMETAPAVANRWGSTPVPFTADAGNKVFSGSSLYAEYAGGTTDHGGAGSIDVVLLIEFMAFQE